MQSQNLFACDLDAASAVFFQQLGAVKRWVNVDEDEVQRSMEAQKKNGSQLWQDLVTVAQRGGWNLVPLLLNSYLAGYAEHLALRQFLRTDIDAWDLDETTTGLRYAVEQELAQKCDQWSALLFLELQEGDRRRQDEQAQSRNRLADAQFQSAERFIEQGFRNQEYLFARSERLLNQREHSLEVESTVVQEAHADAREAHQVTLKAIGETRQAVQGLMPEMMAFLSDAREYVDYNSPATVAKEVARRSARRLQIALAIGLVWLGLIGLVFLGLQRLF